ncbi:MAG TPA: LuxR C-terminal-related transcriptional regulator [Acidimicrobiales bacterium]|nr:LuxR C-terminal-related transcriptional regulator [Acidimicrobiales bacterium]
MASRAGLDVASFLDEASAALASAVPNENHLNGPYWYTLDPESRLITSDYGGDGCELDTSEVMRWEYLDDDVNKYAEVLRHPCGVQTLHEVTRGKPERSRIYREYMAVEGIAQEMLVALGTSAGEFWGTVRLNRLPGQPEFDPEERAFMAAVAPDLAEGIRRGLVVGEARDPDRPDAPGLIILDADGEILSLSDSATRWIERLQDRSTRGSLPASIASAASAAVACARGENPHAESTVLVRSVDRCWVSVHGTVIGVGRTPKPAVIVEPAHPDRITPLLMAIHGLTPREQEVTRLVLQGRSTSQLANRLGISPLTVQQHLKSIFEKVGVRSRRELVGALFFENFEPRVRDNGQRVSAEKPIRGGPLRRVH